MTMQNARRMKAECSMCCMGDVTKCELSVLDALQRARSIRINCCADVLVRRHGHATEQAYNSRWSLAAIRSSNDGPENTTTNVGVHNLDGRALLPSTLPLVCGSSKWKQRRQPWSKQSSRDERCLFPRSDATSDVHHAPVATPTSIQTDPTLLANGTPCYEVFAKADYHFPCDATERAGKRI